MLINAFQNTERLSSEKAHITIARKNKPTCNIYLSMICSVILVLCSKQPIKCMLAKIMAFKVIIELTSGAGCTLISQLQTVESCIIKREMKNSDK